MADNWWQDILQDAVRWQALERVDLVDVRALQELIYTYTMEEMGGLMGKSSGCLTQPRVVYTYPPKGPAGPYTLNLGAFQFAYTYPARRADGELVQNQPPAALDPLQGGVNALNPDDPLSAIGHAHVGYDGENPGNSSSGYYADNNAVNIDDQTIFAQADKMQKAWKGVIVTHDPDNAGQAALSELNLTPWMIAANAVYADVGLAGLYGSDVTPFLWARPIIVDSDSDSRREWDTALGAEQPISINTRRRIRVEFQLAVVEPVVDLVGGVPIAPPWVAIGRLWNWALGTRFAGDGLTIGAQDPQFWPISAWDGAQMWRWVKTYGSGVVGEDDFVDDTGFLGFPIPAAWLAITTWEMHGNISASGTLVGGWASAGTYDPAYDDSDLGLVKLLGWMRQQLLRLNSWNEEFDWDTVGKYHSRGLVETNIWVDEVWDRTGTQLSAAQAEIAQIDMWNDDGYLPGAYDMLYALAREHSFHYWHRADHLSTLASAEYYARGLATGSVPPNRWDPRLFAGHPIAYARMIWDPVWGDESLGYWWLLYSYNLELYSTAYDSGQVGFTYLGKTVVAKNWHKGLMGGGTGGPVEASDVYYGRAVLGFSHKGAFLADQEDALALPPRPLGCHSLSILPNADSAFTWGRDGAYGVDDRFLVDNLVGGEVAGGDASNGLGSVSGLLQAATLWELGGSGDGGVGISGGYGPWHDGFKAMHFNPSTNSWGSLPRAVLESVQQERSVASLSWEVMPNSVAVHTCGPVMSNTEWTCPDGITDLEIPGMLGPMVPVACSFDVVFFRQEDGTILDEASDSGKGFRVPSGGWYGSSFGPGANYAWTDGENPPGEFILDDFTVPPFWP